MQDSSEAVRQLRDRVAVALLALLIVCSLGGYMLATVAGTRALRTRTSLERNESTARLCARLLDEQCDSAFEALRGLARRPSLAEDLRAMRRARLAAHLQNAVELVPDLLSVAVYDTRGELLVGYPTQLPLPDDVARQTWFRRVAASSRPYVGGVAHLPDREHTPVLTVAIPIAPHNGKHPLAVGYLIGYFRLGDIYSWLGDVRIPDGIVLIVDETGRVIASSSDARHGRESSSDTTHLAFPPSFPPFRDALAGKHGSVVTDAPEIMAASGATDPMTVVGFAHAEVPDYSVFILQPSFTAFAASEYLLRRSVTIALPLLALLLAAAWGLVALYERQRRLARTLAERGDLLDRALRAKSDLLANVSHDLKTPIASMRLSVSGLRETRNRHQGDEALDSAAVDECLTVVSEGLDQLGERVRNLLDMARLEADAQPPLREPCDLSDIVAGALERLRPLTRGRTISAHFPSEPLLVECDQPQVESVVINLLENALKYTPAGSPLLLEGEMEENTTIFRLIDTGPGLPDGTYERVFEKFYRAGTSGAPGGTGLGLALCRMIVEAHGGHIWAEPAPKGGAVFAFRLPRIREDDGNDGDEER